MPKPRLQAAAFYAALIALLGAVVVTVLALPDRPLIVDFAMIGGVFMVCLLLRRLAPRQPDGRLRDATGALLGGCALGLCIATAVIAIH